MRVFLAGATGVIGRQLVPMLVAAGHTVVGTTRSLDKGRALEAAGAQPVTVDILDAAATTAAVTTARPDAIVHEATALSQLGNNPRRFDAYFATTNRLRTEGTANLLAAADAVGGVERFVAQSFCGWPYQPVGGLVKSETDPLDPNPPPGFRDTLAAIRRLEDPVSRAPGGVVLRYGALYGPGTSLSIDGPQIKAIRKRMLPVAGDGGGVWSFVHVADAASAAVAALTRGQGIYNIVDDEPAPVRDWLPYLASVVGAKPPRHVPVWLTRLVGGAGAVSMMTRVRGGSNARAKQELQWTPSHPSWRDGFRAELAA